MTVTFVLSPYGQSGVRTGAAWPSRPRSRRRFLDELLEVAENERQRSPPDRGRFGCCAGVAHRIAAAGLIGSDEAVGEREAN